MSGNWIRSNCECIMKNDDGGSRIVTNDLEYTHPHNGQLYYTFVIVPTMLLFALVERSRRYWHRTCGSTSFSWLRCYCWTRQESYHLSNVPCISSTGWKVWRSRMCSAVVVIAAFHTIINIIIIRSRRRKSRCYCSYFYPHFRHRYLVDKNAGNETIHNTKRCRYKMKKIWTTNYVCISLCVKLSRVQAITTSISHPIENAEVVVHCIIYLIQILAMNRIKVFALVLSPTGVNPLRCYRWRCESEEEIERRWAGEAANNKNNNSEPPHSSIHPYGIILGEKAWAADEEASPRYLSHRPPCIVDHDAPTSNFVFFYK